jgi:hypothetical protein
MTYALHWHEIWWFFFDFSDFFQKNAIAELQMRKSSLRFLAPKLKTKLNVDGSNKVQTPLQIDQK